MRRRNFLSLSALPFAAPTAFTLAAQAVENVDLNVVHQIKSEAFNNSQVMDTMFYLCDVNGPRVSGSPGYRKAANFIKTRFTEHGITDVKFEDFEFGRGWQHSKFAAHMIEPAYSEIIGFPLAWTPGTNGPVRGEAIHAPPARPPTSKSGKASSRTRLFSPMHHGPWRCPTSRLASATPPMI